MPYTSVSLTFRQGGRLYVKLFSSILASSVWAEDMPTRLTWVALLAMADREGFVFGAEEGLARMANMPLPAFQKALDTLAAPDRRRPGQEYDGRRIERTSDGIMILNYAKYRDTKDADVRREQVRTAVRKHRAGKHVKSSVISGNLLKAHSDTESSSEAVAVPRTTTATTWLSPYLGLWESRYGEGTGATIAGRMAKALKPLHDKHGAEIVRRQLGYYLDCTDAQYANPQSFAQKFRAWKPQEGTAAYDAEVIRLGKEHLAAEERRRGERK